MRSFFILYFLLLEFSTPSKAVTFDENTPEGSLQREGQLISIQVSRGRPVRVFVVGKEEANFDISKLKLSIKRLDKNGEKAHVLQRTKEGYYTSTDSFTLEKNESFQIDAYLKEKEEKFIFDSKIHNKP